MNHRLLLVGDFEDILYSKTALEISPCKRKYWRRWGRGGVGERGMFTLKIFRLTLKILRLTLKIFCLTWKIFRLIIKIFRLTLEILRLTFEICRLTFKSNLINNIIGLHIFAEQTCWEKTSCPQVFSNNWLGKQQKKLWDTFDKPTSSNAAKVISRKYFRSIQSLDCSWLDFSPCLRYSYPLLFSPWTHFLTSRYLYLCIYSFCTVIAMCDNWGIYFGWPASRSEYQRWSFFHSQRAMGWERLTNHLWSSKPSTWAGSPSSSSSGFSQALARYFDEETLFLIQQNFFQIEFVRKLMNIVDLLAILPYYISLVFYRSRIAFFDVSLRSYCTFKSWYWTQMAA